MHDFESHICCVILGVRVMQQLDDDICAAVLAKKAVYYLCSRLGVAGSTDHYLDVENMLCYPMIKSH